MITILKQPIYLLFIFAIIANIACKKNNNTPKPVDPPVLVPATFLHAASKTIVDRTGKQIMLRGIAFGNEVWSDKEIPNTHHTEEDFKRVPLALVTAPAAIWLKTQSGRTLYRTEKKITKAG